MTVGSPIRISRIRLRRITAAECQITGAAGAADSADVEGIPLLRPRILGSAAESTQQNPSLRLDIGICSGEWDGLEVLEVRPAP